MRVPIQAGQSLAHESSLGDDNIPPPIDFAYRQPSDMSFEPIYWQPQYSPTYRRAHSDPCNPDPGSVSSVEQRGMWNAAHVYQRPDLDVYRGWQGAVQYAPLAVQHPSSQVETAEVEQLAIGQMLKDKPLTHGQAQFNFSVSNHQFPAYEHEHGISLSPGWTFQDGSRPTASQQIQHNKEQSFGPRAEWAAIEQEALRYSAAKSPSAGGTTASEGSYQITYSPSTLGHPDDNFNMTTLAPSQPQHSGFSYGSPQDSSVPLFRAGGDAAPPALKRNFGSMDSTLDGQSPVSAASPDNAPPGKMAIPALKRPRNDSTVNNGPLSQQVILKARPKPGRKPMVDHDDSSDKRKTQNRVAQRNFRDRRAQKCQDLEAENAKLKDEHADAMAKLHNDLSALQAALIQSTAEKANLIAEKARADLECSQAKERILEMQKELDAAKLHHAHSHAAQPQRSNITSNSVSSVHHILTPPSDNYDHQDDQEQDFTFMFSSRKPSAYAPVSPEDHCGFCSDVENCICRQQEELNKSLPPIDSSRATTQPKMPLDISTPSFLEAPTNASGPGTCDMCLADPEKARQCRELAEATGLENKSAQPTRSDEVGTIGTVKLRRLKQLDTPNHTARTSCSDFFQQAQKKNVKLGPANYKDITHVYRYQRPDGRIEHSPYMEMDAQDAAHALAALSRQDTRSGMDRQS
ncbi:hypothetical protein E4T43_08301 [Aureobasidium subglaciale]|nr:hypothetical protein E4T43_08301 [Aureobasidium subglaciale]